MAQNNRILWPHMKRKKKPKKKMKKKRQKKRRKMVIMIKKSNLKKDKIQLKNKTVPNPLKLLVGNLQKMRKLKIEIII